MALLPAANRDKALAGVAFLALAVSAYYVLSIWQPARDALDEKQARVESLLVLNQSAKSEVALGRTNQVREEAERYASDLEVMRRLVPTGNEVGALLDQVSTASRRVGLDISDVQPLPSLVGDQYEAYKYRLSVRGAYNQIGVLLTNIGSLQRIVAPINLTLASTPPDPRAPKVKNQQPLEARFEIQTYVARTPPPPAKGSQAGKP